MAERNGTAVRDDKVMRLLEVIHEQLLKARREGTTGEVTARASLNQGGITDSKVTVTAVVPVK